MLCRRSLIAASIALPFAAQAQGSFRSFLAEVSREAWAAGVPSRISASAFLGLMPDPEVIERDQTQPEFTLTWAQYRARVLPPSRIANGRQAFLDNTSLLHNIGLNYGVDPGVILAIWGIESNYGANKGKFQLIRSLATLAYQGRRGGYFKSELINALKILADGYATQDMLLSGWAGAMGQPQFMPSSYLKSAVDFEGTGRRDIWNSVPDTLASIANYLAQHGWQRGESWGEPVTYSPGSMAPGDKILTPDAASPDLIYLTHPNFGVIKRYNPSDFYALAVGLLADAVV